MSWTYVVTFNHWQVEQQINSESMGVSVTLCNPPSHKISQHSNVFGASFRPSPARETESNFFQHNVCRRRVTAAINSGNYRDCGSAPCQANFFLRNDTAKIWRASSLKIAVSDANVQVGICSCLMETAAGGWSVSLSPIVAAKVFDFAWGHLPNKVWRTTSNMMRKKSHLFFARQRSQNLIIKWTIMAFAEEAVI